MPIKLKDLIKASKKKLDTRDESGRTALMFLAEYQSFAFDSDSDYHKYVDLVNTVLDNNSSEAALNVHQQGDCYDCYPEYYNTALISAAFNDNRAVVEAILNRNRTEAVINARNGRGNTALMVASIKNRSQIITAILKSNSSEAIVNARNGIHGTALIIAARENRPECIRAILSINSSESVVNARITSQCSNDETALIVAASKGYADVVNAILEYNSSNFVISAQHGRYNGNTALIEASHSDHVEVVRTILKYNSSDAMVNIQNHGGETALSVAVTSGHVGIIRAILEKNSSEAVLSRKEKDCWPLLVKAIMHDEPDSVRALLDKTPLVGLLNAKSIHGESVLQWAKGRGSHEIQQIILQKMRCPRYLLECKINGLKQYGAQLSAGARSGDGHYAGVTAIDLANRLMAGLAAYYTSANDERRRKSDDFMAILQTGYHSMGKHIRPGFFHRLLREIATLFRKISTSMLNITPMSSAATSFFFKTTRQRYVSSIATAFLTMEPAMKLVKKDIETQTEEALSPTKNTVALKSKEKVKASCACFKY